MVGKLISPFNHIIYHIPMNKSENTFHLFDSFSRFVILNMIIQWVANVLEEDDPKYFH